MNPEKTAMQTFILTYGNSIFFFHYMKIIKHGVLISFFFFFLLIFGVENVVKTNTTMKSVLKPQEKEF